MPSILQEALTKTRNSILELLEPLMAKIYKFTAVVENAITRISIDASDAACYSSQSEETASDANEEIEWAIEMLTASRQQEIYIRLLSKEK